MSEATDEQPAAEEAPPGPGIVMPQPVPVTVNVAPAELAGQPFVVIQFASVNGTGVYFLPRDAALEFASTVKKTAQKGPQLAVAQRPGLILPR